MDRKTVTHAPMRHDPLMAEWLRQGGVDIAAIDSEQVHGRRGVYFFAIVAQPFDGRTTVRPVRAGAVITERAGGVEYGYSCN